jgi:phage gp36-like protein
VTYALKTDMQSEFGDAELGQLTDRTNGTVIDDTVLGDALTRADSEINSYVSQRYSLPFASAPTRLRDIACDMARYYLYDARAPKVVQDRYNAAVAWLKDVAAGRALVGVDASSSLIPSGSNLAISVLASDQVFTDDVLALQ